jgi:hypothetical protein
MYEMATDKPMCSYAVVAVEYLEHVPLLVVGDEVDHVARLSLCRLSRQTSHGSGTKACRVLPMP